MFLFAPFGKRRIGELKRAQLFVGEKLISFQVCKRPIELPS